VRLVLSYVLCIVHLALFLLNQTLAFNPNRKDGIMCGNVTVESHRRRLFSKIVNHSSDHTPSESVAIYFHQETSFVLNTSSVLCES